MARRRASSEAAPAGKRSIERLFYAEIRQQMRPTGKSAFDLHGYALTLLCRTMELVERHRSGDAADLADEELAASDLAAALSIIMECEDAAMCRAALSGIVAAQTLGLYHRGMPGVIQRAKADADRERTVAALQARRQGRCMDDIRAVIDRHAAAHLRSYPEDTGNADRVAQAITDPVARDVQGIAGIKRPWLAPVLPLLGEEHDRCTGRIRKQIPLCSCWTTVSRT